MIYHLFLSKAGSPPSRGVRGAPGGSSSASIGELWPGIDQLDEVGPVGTSTVLTHDS
jgi:hypothetical protein